MKTDLGITRSQGLHRIIGPGSATIVQRRGKKLNWPNELRSIVIQVVQTRRKKSRGQNYKGRIKKKGGWKDGGDGDDGRPTGLTAHPPTTGN